MCIREAEGESGKNMLGEEGRNEELKNTMSCGTIFLIFTVTVVHSRGCVSLKHKHPRTISNGFQTMSY